MGANLKGCLVWGSKRSILTSYLKSTGLFTPGVKFSSNSVQSQPGADCKVSNTRMFQGQSFEGGTIESQLVRWSVKTVRELPSFSL